MRGSEVDGVLLAAVVGTAAPRRSDRSADHGFAAADDTYRHRRLAVVGLGSPSRARMSTTVTMRPRRLRRLAISADYSGTRVSRSA